LRRIPVRDRYFMRPIDITSIVITDEAVVKKLPSIFVDSIVVDCKFDILLISQNMLDLLEFNAEEVEGKNLNYFSGSYDLVSQLQENIANGYFDEKKTTLCGKTNRCIQVGISGFYLGLISDINGYIVLKIRNLEEVEKINKQLQQKTEELDEFVYRTAHDLRGPLATIKGLLNLLKIREDNDEVDRFILLLDAHANKLDERLFQLLYLAQSNENKNRTSGFVDFSCLETNLRKIIEQNAFVDFLEFQYIAPAGKMDGIDDTLLSSLLGHALLYLLSLPMNTTQAQVVFRIAFGGKENLRVTIDANGFETNHSLRVAIQQSDYVYTNMTHHPQLTNFYAAQKIGLELKTKIKLQFLGTDRQQLTFTIPIGEIAKH
jgi:signal transduction histidine kinase